MVQGQFPNIYIGKSRITGEYKIVLNSFQPFISVMRVLNQFEFALSEKLSVKIIELKLKLIEGVFWDPFQLNGKVDHFFKPFHMFHNAIVGQYQFFFWISVGSQELLKITNEPIVQLFQINVVHL